MAAKKQSHSLLQPGNKVFVRTVTNFFTGIVVAVEDQEVHFEEASWIADTGRFHNFLKDGATGSAVEVEPIPDGKLTIGRGAIVDVTNFTLELPRSQK